jgi:hypothetical protein
MARHVLTLLQRDHYIIQHTDGAYRFSFPLVKRWWRLDIVKLGMKDISDILPTDSMQE